MANTNSSFPPAGKTVWHICNGTAAVLAIVGFLLDTPRNIYDHPANDYVKDFVVAHLDQKYESLLKCTGRIDYE